MNTYEIIKYFAVFVFFINLMLILFTYFSLGNGLALTVPALNSVTSYQNNMTTATGFIATALSSPNITPSSCTSGDLVCAGYNLGVGLWNIVFGLFSIIINVVILLMLGIGIVALMMFSVLPEFLTVINLGFLGTILVLVNGAVILIMGFYAFEILIAILQSRSVGR